MGRLFSAVFGDLLGARYFETVFWDQLVGEKAASRRGGDILEIGVAPGLNVLRRAKRLAMTPWGIEYSPIGAELSRVNFSEAGIDGNNVICGDALDPELLSKYKSKFDLVYSAGLIEHFADPHQIIAAHIELAAEDGLIVITIPNLRGIYSPLLRIVNPALLVIHNLELMKIDKFRAAMDHSSVELLFAEYCGFVDFDVIHAPGTLIANVVLAMTTRLNAVLNLFATRFFGGRRMETSYFSPYLVAVLRKSTETRRSKHASAGVPTSI